MVSSGLFHPSEVANIYRVIMITKGRGGRRCRVGNAEVPESIGRDGKRDREDRTQTLTLMTLSQPAETMTGLAGLGENRTHETLDKSHGPQRPRRPSASLSSRPTSTANTRDSPLRVTLLLDIKLALSQSVPKLDSLVPGGRDDLPVVGRERDREDVVGVTDESTGGRPGVEVPQSEGVVPRRGEGELAWTSGLVET